MNSAVYGRMRIGMCLQGEGNLSAALGNGLDILGCSANVLPLLDRRCSGKSECELRGTDDDLERVRPCLAALKSYLEADYECATGESLVS